MELFKRCTIVLFALLFTGAVSRAQGELDERLVELQSQASKLLIGFAKRCESYKAPARARRIYAMVIEHYEPDNALARRGLGHRKKDGAWIESGGDKSADTSNDRQREQITRSWSEVAPQVGRLHREYGKVLQQEGKDEAAKQHFERAIHFDPSDAESHRALGHEEIEGYFGTPEQVAFIKRMHAILAKSHELREKSYETELLPADKMPAELKATGLPMFGARSKHFTIWVIDDAEDAVSMLQWGERCYELLEFLLDNQSRRLRSGAVRWFAVLRNDAQRDQMFERSPTTTGKYSVAEARLFSGISFQAAGGKAAVWWSPKDNDGDRVVAHVVRHFFASSYNDALGEGLMHCCQWLLCDSVLTYFAALPHTVAAGSWTLPRVPEEWFKFLQSEIDQNQDWPLVQVPRERMDSFRDRVRVKAWSFMLYLVAREPHRWVRFVSELSEDGMMPEKIGETIEDVLERPVEEIEQEYREWARSGSRLGRATHWQ